MQVSVQLLPLPGSRKRGRRGKVSSRDTREAIEDGLDPRPEAAALRAHGGSAPAGRDRGDAGAHARGARRQDQIPAERDRQVSPGRRSRGAALRAAQSQPAIETAGYIGRTLA